MSKRIGAVSAETKERILSAAREEFSSCGFQGSSLRRICAAAGVTTGALYFFFESKDALFRRVLSEVTVPFNGLMEEHYALECASSGRDTKSGEDADFDISRRLIDLYFRNRQIWDILLRHLDHPAVREFLDEFVESSTEHYLCLLSSVPTGSRSPDRFAIHQFVHMQTDAMLTLISHDFTQREMISHAQTVILMLRGAFRALLSLES